MGEAKPARLQPFLNSVEKLSGAGAANNCRSTLSGMMKLAVVKGAFDRNPVRELERISRPQEESRAASALSSKEIPTFPGAASRRSPPDRARHRRTGRIHARLRRASGKVCALDVSSVDFVAGAAELDAVNVRVTEKGMVRQSFPKTKNTRRVHPLPSRKMDMLRRWHERLGEFASSLFPTRVMTLRDPSNTQREIRDRRDSWSYLNLSTHSLRKTVATMLEQAGLSGIEIADDPGHGTQQWHRTSSGTPSRARRARPRCWTSA